MTFKKFTKENQGYLKRTAVSKQINRGGRRGKRRTTVRTVFSMQCLMFPASAQAAPETGELQRYSRMQPLNFQHKNGHSSDLLKLASLLLCSGCPVVFSVLLLTKMKRVTPQKHKGAFQKAHFSCNLESPCGLD